MILYRLKHRQSNGVWSYATVDLERFSAAFYHTPSFGRDSGPLLIRFDGWNYEVSMDDWKDLKKRLAPLVRQGINRMGVPEPDIPDPSCDVPSYGTISRDDVTATFPGPIPPLMDSTSGTTFPGYHIFHAPTPRPATTLGRVTEASTTTSAAP